MATVWPQHIEGSVNIPFLPCNAWVLEVICAGELKHSVDGKACTMNFHAAPTECL